MSARDDGGPAFPSIASEFTGIDSDGAERWENGPTGGMTLRDYFAAKVMQAACSHVGTSPVEDWLASNARYAYVAADAMLKARQA